SGALRPGRDRLRRCRRLARLPGGHRAFAVASRPRPAAGETPAALRIQAPLEEFGYSQESHMTCQEFWSLMQESPAPGPRRDATPADLLLDHMRGCISCADLMQRQRALRAGLRRMATEQAGLKAPASVETTLLRQFRAHAGSAHTPVRAGLGWQGMLTGR